MKNYFRNHTISVKQFGYRSDHLGPNCLQRLSATDNKSLQARGVTPIFHEAGQPSLNKVWIMKGGN